MSGVTTKWDDLALRLMTGLVLAAVAAAAVWAGGAWFLGFVAIICGLMLWELTRMVDGTNEIVPAMFGISGTLVVVLVHTAGDTVGLLALSVVAVAVGLTARHTRSMSALYAACLMLATVFLVNMRLQAGAAWVVWLILLVVATDVAGYVVGRSIGGRKFWPRVSPKKTWSGVIGGWIAAAVVGSIMAPVLGAGKQLIWISAFLALASQFGDIAESALKRRSGVKDSSNILPGHGGVLDRFDALLGATLGFMLYNAVLITLGAG